ncbi:MAG: FtsX-like permease family protein, partial [Anaerolineae bacterium]
MNSLSYLIRRAGHYWPVLATLSLGVLLATALLASGPVLVSTVIEFGLRRTLLNADPPDVNLRLITAVKPDIARYRDLDAPIRDLVQARLGSQLDQVISAGSTHWAFPWVGQELLADQRVNLRFYDADAEHLLEQVEFLAGAWPDDVRPQPDVVAAVIGKALAQAYGLQVGDRLPLSLHGQAGRPDFWLQVAGIVRPSNARAPYWFGTLSPLQPQSSASYVAQFGALVPTEALFELAADLFRSSHLELSWNVLLSPGAMALADLPRLQAQLAALAKDVSALEDGLRVETGLDAVLAAFVQQAETIRAPLYFLIATIVLLALYYVTMAAALSLRQVQREFAVLRSRGASVWQLFRLQLFEACLIGGVAVVSGPILALLFVQELATLGPLRDVRQAEWVLQLPQAAWLSAAVGAAACVASLLVPVPAALRRSIVAHQQSLARASQPPWWQRLYLDVFVLLAGLILLWRLRIYGSILGGAPARPQVDWLLLLSPLALLLGSATILLRVFPLLLRLGAGLVSQGRGLPAVLALWQTARDPAHIARLVLLLTLAMALGLFSTGLNTALDRSEADGSRYKVGSDLRIVGPAFGTEGTLEGTPDVRAFASVWRGQGSLVMQVDRRHPFFDVLAIEPHTFVGVTHYRSDFADQPVSELLDKLQMQDDAPQPTLPLPGQPERLGLWLWIAEQAREQLDRLDVVAKLQVGQGVLSPFRLRLSETISGTEDGWYYFEGALPAKHSAPSLHSLWVQNRFQLWGQPVRQLALDDLTVTDAETKQRKIVEDFEDAQPRWQVSGPQMSAEEQLFQPHTGEACLGLNFEAEGMREHFWYGVQLADVADDESLPALVSPAFQAITQLQVGDLVGTWVDSHPVEFQVVGIVRYFPTMYENEDAGFLITVQAPLLRRLNNARRTPFNSNEILVSIAPDTSVPDLAADRAQLWETEAVRKAIKADPLALGLRSVTLFGYLLTAVLSLAGFGTHFYTSVRQRETVYVVLRALGLSPRQLYGTLLFEQVLLIFSGLALGTILGLLLNRLTLPGLPLSLGGLPPVPPFLAQTD